MGVVRREGDWRLEKRGEGHYTITYQKEVQLKVLTPDYTPGEFEDPLLDTVPVREVGSYAEAEGLFEERAHGSAPNNFGLGGEEKLEPLDTSLDRDIDDGLDDFGSDLEDMDAPPGVIAIALILVGGIVVYTQGFQPTETVFQVGILLSLGGLVIFAWGVAVGKSEGWDSVFELLFESDESPDQNSDSSPDVQTTPPPSEKTKNALIFDRASQCCEWCDDRSDHLEIHHIEPRSKGGSNDPSNLIVLCPNHHRQADAGGISKTKLKAKVRRLPEITID